MDGIDIFTLPNLMHLGTIKHTLYPSSNVVLGITFIGNSYIISGGCGQIWISEAESLRVLAGLQGQETSKYSPAKIVWLVLQSYHIGIYRAVSVPISE